MNEIYMRVWEYLYRSIFIYCNTTEWPSWFSIQIHWQFQSQCTYGNWKERGKQ